jgi:hypothetical protein
MLCFFFRSTTNDLTTTYCRRMRGPRMLPITFARETINPTVSHYATNLCLSAFVGLLCLHCAGCVRFFFSKHWSIAFVPFQVVLQSSTLC